MLRNILLAALCLVPCLLFSQMVDSVALRQGDSLLQVSRALTNKREFDKAFEVNAALEKLVLEKFGRESGQYGSCCHNRGRIYQNKGNYPEAEKHYLEANNIYAKTRGADHPDYASSLTQLATLYRLMGEHKKSETLHLEAIAIYIKVYGKGDPKYAVGLHNLANLYSDVENFEAAETLYLEAKAIREKMLGKEHAAYAVSLNSLANLYSQMGQYEKSEPLYLESKAIREKMYGKEHLNYALSLTTLASLYLSMGNYEKAEPLLLEAKAIREKKVSKDHPDNALNLSLAKCYYYMGNYEKAEPIFLEIKALEEKVLGTEHPSYATTLLSLATLYHDMGNYEKAEPLFLESQTIIEKSLGKKHSNYAINLLDLAMFYQDLGNYEKAAPFYKEHSLVNQSILEKAVNHLSERELSNYLNQFLKSQHPTLSFVQLSASKKVAVACYDNSLFYKGFMLQSTGRLRHLALSDTGTAEKYNQMIGYQRRLAKQYAQPIADRDSATIADLETKANDLEKDLARIVAGWGQATKQVSWQEVQAALKPNEAALELVHYRFYHKKQTDTMLYAALVLLPGSDSPQFIPLFEEGEITPLFKNKGARKSDYVNNLYELNTLTAGQKNLYNAIWKPLESILAGSKTVYFSPSGLLHKVNFNAIKNDKGQALSDRFQLVQLGSTRQLVVPTDMPHGFNLTAQLYGGIQYDATPTVTPNTKVADMTALRSSSSFNWGVENDSILRGDNWVYLNSTAVEISNAAKTMKANGITPTLLKGAEATEESFKLIGTNGPSPRILHVATHGFFFPDPQTTEGFKTLSSLGFKISENPMIRSGLVLAGGNHAWKTGKALRPDLEDGILTAYEISQMNLANTELVVLSACETGLGDLVGNEGVYGLQRAFKIAGAQHIIMSLWQVPDVQTQELMTAFYTNWLSQKMPIPEAFGAAQKAMRDKYEHPFFWAGFVLVE
jgi:CHAT domain-containing protein